MTRDLLGLDDEAVADLTSRGAFGTPDEEREARAEQPSSATEAAAR